MSKFKEGMNVFDLKYGWGKVVEIDYDIDHDYPIGVEYLDTVETDENETYTEDGRWSTDDKYPTLFLESEVPKEWLERYPKPIIKHEEVVYVNSYKNGEFTIYYREEDAISLTRFNEGKTCKATLTWEEYL